MLITTGWFDAVPDLADRGAIWDIYVNAFSEHRKEAVAEQMVYDQDAFMAALSDTDIRKLVVRGDGAIAGFCFMTETLEKASLNYLNVDYVAKKFPEDHRDRKIFYVTVFAVAPGAQGAGGIFQRVMDEVAELVISHSGRIMFDCSNNVNSWLPHAIKRSMERGLQNHGLPSDDVNLDLVGTQEYWMLDLFKRK